MSTIFLTLTTFLIFSFTHTTDCGDGSVYANKKQTAYDKRFDNFQKIGGVPKYKGGEKKLEKLIRSKLKLSGVAKTQVFYLTYQFTVTCAGKIKDVKQIGDSKAEDWTNIVEIIQGTEADWSPANKDGKPVDCVYFNKIFINGSQY